MNESEMKPCPFCGAAGKLWFHPDCDDVLAMCSAHGPDHPCPATGFLCGSEKEAIEYWNQRPSRDSVNETSCKRPKGLR